MNYYIKYFSLHEVVSTRCSTHWWKAGLEKHRKVFEVLGNRTMCQPTDNQLSGVGFTSARGDSVVVKVDGKKLYNVKF